MGTKSLLLMRKGYETYKLNTWSTSRDTESATLLSEYVPGTVSWNSGCSQETENKAHPGGPLKYKVRKSSCTVTCILFSLTAAKSIG